MTSVIHQSDVFRAITQIIRAETTPIKISSLEAKSNSLHDLYEYVCLFHSFTKAGETRFAIELHKWIASVLEKFLITTSFDENVVYTDLAGYSTTLVSLYSHVVLTKQLPIVSSIDMIWKYVGLFSSFKVESVCFDDSNPFSVSKNQVERFLFGVIENLSPAYEHLGMPLVDELKQSQFYKAHLVNSSHYNLDKYTEMRLAHSKRANTSIEFKKYQDAFQYDKDIDIKFSAKFSQIQSGINNERQSSLDNLQEIFRKYEKQPTLINFKENLLSQCQSLLNIRECNFPHLAEIFMQMYLHYGLQGSSTAHKTGLESTKKNISTTMSSTVVGFGSSQPTVAVSPITPVPKMDYASAAKLNSLNKRMMGDSPSFTSSFTPSSVQSSTSVSSSSFSVPSSSAKKSVNASPAILPSSGYRGFAAATAATSTRKPPDTIDIFEAPSGEFVGLQEFFFRFIVHVDSSRFNSCLVDCILAEIMSLIQPENAISSENVSTKSNNSSGSKLTNKLSSLDFENFALLICKLHLLGKLLGLLQFYSHWTITSDSVEYKSVSVKQHQLSMTLPFVSLLEKADASGCLCLYVAWICSYYKMAKWDSTLVQSVSHMESINCLNSIQFSKPFRLRRKKSGNVDENESTLSCNRIYILLELQTLLEYLQLELLQPTIRFNSEKSSDIIGKTIDNGDQAFSLIFLYHIFPELKVTYDDLKSKNREALVITKPIATLSITPIVKTITPVKINELSAKKKAPPQVNPQANPLTKIDEDKAIEEQPVLSITRTLSTTPTDCKSPTNIKIKKAKKKMNIGINSANSSTESFTNQFQPVESETPNKLPKPPGLIGRSVSTPTKPGTPTGKSNASFLNAISPSPVKYRSTSLAESLHDAGDSDTIIQLTDMKDRLETVFWSQHEQLEQVVSASRNHAYEAIKVHYKEQTAIYLQELMIGKVEALKSEVEKYNSSVRNEQYKLELEQHLRLSLKIALQRGKVFITDFYTNFITKVLPSLCVMYPLNKSVLHLALCFATKQANDEQTAVIYYFETYCTDKFQKLCDAAINNYIKEHPDKVDEANESSITPIAQPLSRKVIKFVSSKDFTNIISVCLKEVLADESNILNSSDKFLTMDMSNTLTDSNIMIALDISSIGGFRNSVLLLLFNIHLAVSSITSLLASQESVLGLETLLQWLLPNLTMLLAIILMKLKEALNTVITLHSENACATDELKGKIVVEFSKFLTTMLPHLVFLDSVYFQVACDNCTINSLKSMSPSAHFPSDIVRCIHDCELISLDALIRLLPNVVKNKTIIYYQTCKQLYDLKQIMNEGVLFVLGRLLTCGESNDVDNCEDKKWWSDDAFTVPVLSKCGDNVAKLVVNLQKLK